MSNRKIARRARAVAWTNASIIEWQRRRLAEAGHDPTSVPDEPCFRFLRLPEVLKRTGLSTSSLYRAIAADQFPPGVPIDRIVTPSQSQAA